MTDVFVKGYTKPADGLAKFIEVNMGSSSVCAPVSGVDLVETGHEIRHVRLTLTGVVVATADHTTSGGEGSKQLLTFPAGNILVLGAISTLALTADGTGLLTGAELVSSIGSAVAGTGATLSGTEADIIPSTVSTLTSLAGAMAGKSTAIAQLNGTSTNAKAYLNFAVADAGHGDGEAGSVTVTGTIDIFYKNLGDI